MNDEVMEDVEDAKLGDMNQAICDGIYGESEGVETVVLKRNQEIFSRVPFSVFVDSVLSDHQQNLRLVRDGTRWYARVPEGTRVGYFIPGTFI